MYVRVIHESQPGDDFHQTVRPYSTNNPGAVVLSYTALPQTCLNIVICVKTRITRLAHGVREQFGRPNGPSKMALRLMRHIARRIARLTLGSHPAYCSHNLKSYSYSTTRTLCPHYSRRALVRPLTTSGITCSTRRRRRRPTRVNSELTPSLRTTETTGSRSEAGCCGVSSRHRRIEPPTFLDSTFRAPTVLSAAGLITLYVARW